MQLPLIGKVKQPAPWVLGLITAGVVGAGGITYAVLQQNSKPVDISDLVVSVEAQTLRVRIEANGTVQPAQTVNLSPKSAGTVARLLVEQGDRVQKGQVIAQMDSGDVSAQITQARAKIAQAEARLNQLRNGNRPEEISQSEARVSQAEAQVNEAVSRLRLAEDKVRRNASLETEGAISSDRFNEIQAEATNARAVVERLQAGVQEAKRNLALLRNGTRAEEIEQAEAQLLEARGALEAVQIREEDTYIRAPFNGVITQKFANEGAFVTPTTSASEATSATSTAIVSLAQGLEVIAEVPEVDIRQLKLGQPVEIMADAYPDETFKGRVRLIAPEAVVKQNVTSFQVRITVTSGFDKLLSGMNVDTTFLGDSLTDALVVPTVAIRTEKGKTGVLVPDADDQPTFKAVTLGSSVEDQTQVLDGLKPGDRVFIEAPPGWEMEQKTKKEEEKKEEEKK
jgi:HlyD family secretion protein